MSTINLIDYGCHSLSYRLAEHLSDSGVPTRYFVNGSVESPNRSSLVRWAEERPDMVRNIQCKKPFEKMNLVHRLRGETEWGSHCLRALEAEEPAAVVVSCVPLVVVTRIEAWCRRRHIPLIYWLQDIQARAIYDLLGNKLGFAGRILGGLAQLWEQDILDRSRMVITIAPDHERELPPSVRKENRYRLLENWGNLEDFPQFPRNNHWAIRHGVHQTLNVMYTGTLGMKHDLNTFFELAHSFRDRPDVRIVIVSSGQAADYIGAEALRRGLHNITLLPFQPHEDVAAMLASAAVLIAPLDPAAGSFCVPSKILSYLCAGRAIVLAIDPANLAARTIIGSKSGLIVKPGDSGAFVSAVTRLVNSPADCLEAGRNGRAYAEAHFNLDSVAENFLNIITASGVALLPRLTPVAEPGLVHSATA